MARVIKGSGGPKAAPQRRPQRGGGPRRVLQKAVYNAKQQAEDIKREAEEERERLLAEGKRRAAQLREEAQAEGAAEAFAEAAAEALTAFRRRAQRYAEAADDVRYLSLEVVRKILSHPPQLSERAVEVIVDQGMNRLRARRKLRVQRPRPRLDALSRERPALLDALHREPDLLLEATDDVSEGYCRVVIEVGGALCAEQAALDSLAEALEVNEQAVAPRPQSRLDHIDDDDDDESTQALPADGDEAGTDARRSGYGGVRLSVTAPDHKLPDLADVKIGAGERARPLGSGDPEATMALDVSELRGELAGGEPTPAAEEAAPEADDEYEYEYVDEDEDEEYEDDDDLDLFADDSLPDR
jgi:flagellar biosynthesis/type III secretory pathway protein FliH